MLTRRMVVLAGTLIFTFSVSLQAEKQSADLRRFNFERVEMGVIFRLSVYASDSDVANKAADAAYARVSELNGVFSDYDGASEARRLCELSGPGQPVKVSNELFSLLEASLQLSRDTDGALRRRLLLQPCLEPERLAAERKLVGYHLIRLDSTAKSVELLRPGMRIDFGGIAKGFAADEALRVLAEHGLDRALVDASGDIVAGDPPPDADSWVVAIEALRHRSTESDGKNSQQAGPAPRLKICNQAVATSGDAYQSIAINGRRYSHIVDPKTGLGLNQRSSVTIIAPNGMMADALASAVSVLGPTAGVELLDQPHRRNMEGYVMFAKGESDRVQAAWSAGLRKFLVESDGH